MWPLDKQKLDQWLRRRADKKGLQISNDGFEVLLQRIEGNLLAAIQELEKLYALFGSAPISVGDISTAVEDNARFDVFKLTDGMLSGNMRRVSRVLNGLMAEKLAAPVVLWAITRELRLLAALSFEQNILGRVDKVFQKHRVWEVRKRHYITALNRGKLNNWQSLLQDCLQAEKVIKGANKGSEWELIERICLKVCQPTLFVS